MAQNKRKKITTISQIPDFDQMSLQEEAKWWETHDLSEVWDKLDDVKLKISPDAFRAPKQLRQMSSVINIRLDRRDHSKLRLVANRKGLGTATLVRMWILEKLHSSEKKAASR